MMTRVLRPPTFALALLFCGALAGGARAQRVGPVEDEPAPPAPRAAAERKGDAKAADRAAPKEEVKKSAPSGEGTKTAAKDEAKKPAQAAGDAKREAGPDAVASAPLGERAAGTTGSAPVSDASPQATTPPVTVSPSFGALPAPPKYEPPPSAKTDPPASAPVVAAAPSAIYRVGAGDILDIRMVGGLSRDGTLFTVLSNGTIDYPLAGEATVASGLTPEEIGARLSAALKRRGIFDRAQFQVTVRDYASHTVLVSGLVDQPGQKFLRREAVPLYVVLAEAFPRADAGRAVIISRASGQSKTLDLADSASLNELVSHGDVINVQPRPREFYYVGGLINAPGQKDYTVGMTLTQAILASGGASREAGERARVVVARQGADGRLVSTDYALREIQEGRVPDPRIQSGDRIEIVKKR